MKNLFFLILLSICLFSCETMPTKTEVYTIHQEIVQDAVKSLVGDIDFPFMDYQFDDLNDSTYLIISNFEFNNGSAKDKFKYKAKLKYKGGKWANKNNWELIGFEEYKGL